MIGMRTYADIVFEMRSIEVLPVVLNPLLTSRVLLIRQSKVNDGAWYQAMNSARKHLPSRIEVVKSTNGERLPKALVVRFGRILGLSSSIECFVVSVVVLTFVIVVNARCRIHCKEMTALSALVSSATPRTRGIARPLIFWNHAGGN